MPRSKSKGPKSEATGDEPSQPKLKVITDLNKFKFQKKPHLKIEFENQESRVREETKGLWEPQNWREFLINLQNMRSNNDAPVDSMGCHMAMDVNASPKVRRFQSLIALMLSSQTKDQVTFAAMERLRARGLTVNNVLSMTDEELGQLIYPVGFWKTKVKYIKKTTQTLKELYNGDIPDTIEKLCKLTGVGPKMAHICMKVAWDKVTGIGVDTHVHRISNRIKWVKNPTKTPEETRKALEAWLPYDLWSEVNHLMVGFGQTICLPINPICNECLNNDICPSSGKMNKSPKKSQLKSPIKKNENLDNFEKDNNVLNIKLTQSPERMLTSFKQLPQKTVINIDIKNEIQDDLDSRGMDGINTGNSNVNQVKKHLKSPKTEKEPDKSDRTIQKSPVKRKLPQRKVKESQLPSESTEKKIMKSSVSIKK